MAELNEGMEEIESLHDKLMADPTAHFFETSCCLAILALTWVIIKTTNLVIRLKNC